MPTWSQIAAQAMRDQVETFKTDAPVSYTVTGLSPVTVSFPAAFSEGIIDGEKGSPYARLFVAPSDVPSGAKKGDSVVVGVVTYAVIEVISKANQLARITIRKT